MTVTNTSTKGYSIWIAATFFMSFMVGMGMVTLPKSLAQTGWWGLLLFGLAIANSVYCTALLGKTWTMLEDGWEKYRVRSRYPYPAMAHHAVGSWMRYIVTGVLHLSLVGLCTAIILVVAQFIQVWTNDSVLEYKYWIMIVGSLLWPLTWFGSIEEYVFAGVGAGSSIIIASVCILSGIILAKPKQENQYNDVSNMYDTSVALGTLLFAVSGCHVFPTIQNDMADRKQYIKAIFLGFGGLILLYIPVMIAGYIVFGSTVSSNIVLSIPQGPLTTVITASLTIHVFLAYLIAINPVAQEMEDILNLPKVFNYKRCLVRGALVLITSLAALAVPYFDKVMSLIGGTTVTLLTFVFPPICYYQIRRLQVSESEIESTRISCVEKLALLQVLIFGVLSFLFCTYFAMYDIIVTIIHQ